MLEIALLLIGFGFAQSYLTVTSLFNFAAGLVAFFFIVVAILIFIFVYDNLRKQRKTTAPA
ncbi:MAG: hypothetical protein JRN20_13120 [Nitrososphaerota archaeon]|jgi:uncharacterized membrane protein|nr:hypothetical protein [Nitrososphaerota archaeon]MDG6923306.1 hypothetical protein [Nitrososphaerota archaeon]